MEETIEHQHMVVSVHGTEFGLYESVQIIISKKQKLVGIIHLIAMNYLVSMVPNTPGNANKKLNMIFHEKLMQV